MDTRSGRSSVWTRVDYLSRMRPSDVGHVVASALRGCNELVTSHQVSAETPERALGIPIDTVYDLCAACAALWGGGGLFTWSELVHAEVDAPRSSGARASQRMQKTHGVAPWQGAVPGMIAVRNAKLLAAKDYRNRSICQHMHAPPCERGTPVQVNHAYRPTRRQYFACQNRCAA